MQPPLPPALLASLEHIKGFEKDAFIQAHEPSQQVTSVRMNPFKRFNEDCSILKIRGKVPWSSEGYYLQERPSFTADPLFHAGAYYVQEASSMFLEETLRQTVDLSMPLKVLDLCAAPGGKSTLIQSLISPESILVSNEVIKTRVPVLAENLTKWGAANVVVTSNDPKDFSRLEGYFDVIVVDAPCSGSGLFRKDPAAIDEWSPGNVAMCSQRQQRILADVMPSLKPGGVLIYATCSYSEEEDETIASWLPDAYPLESRRLNIHPDWHIVETISGNRQAAGYRFFPNLLNGEGFFMAAFQHTGIATPGKDNRRKNKLALPPKQSIEAVKPWLKESSELSFFEWQDHLLAVPYSLLNELPVLQSALYIKKAGVTLGTVIRNELIPGHELAMSTLLNKQVHVIEADRETALQFLRRAAVDISTSQQGWAVFTYGHLPLGWVKVLPGRINNYYPKDWRILNK